jgi:hypothetical protein
MSPMPRLLAAHGYQGDAMALPVGDVESAAPFYETMLGFRAASRIAGPPRAIVLERDDVRMALVENGGDSSQDGCAFEVDDVGALLEELRSRGLSKGPSDIDMEAQADASWRVFYVVAPDGLDREPVGSALELDGLPCTVVGIAPEGFDIPAGARFWIPRRPGT